MRITWKTLKELIDRMTQDQLNSDVTVEIPMGDDDDVECFSAELRIAAEDHSSLEENHPVIYVHQDDKEHERTDDINQIAHHIGLELPKGQWVKAATTLESDDGTGPVVAKGTAGVVQGLSKDLVEDSSVTLKNPYCYVVEFEGGTKYDVEPSEIELIPPKE